MVPNIPYGLWVLLGDLAESSVYIRDWNGDPSCSVTPRGEEKSSHSTATRPRENFSHISRGGALTPLDGRVAIALRLVRRTAQRDLRTPTGRAARASRADSSLGVCAGCRGPHSRSGAEGRVPQWDGWRRRRRVSPCGIAVVAGSDRQPGRLPSHLDSLRALLRPDLEWRGPRGAGNGMPPEDHARDDAGRALTLIMVFVMNWRRGPSAGGMSKAGGGACVAKGGDVGVMETALMG
ncbi:hypothetical protein BC826DRAFT_1173265 [Russula brevipes]|nr:hypothetical protein BC826DRAFT_1173265 [Russula brevipes]